MTAYVRKYKIVRAREAAQHEDNNSNSELKLQMMMDFQRTGHEDTMRKHGYGEHQH